MPNKAVYESILTLSGCNSGTCTTLYTAGSLIHDGYNEIDFTGPWKYESYKISGNATGSCRLAELELTGRVVYAVQTCTGEHTFDCDAVVDVRNGEQSQTLNNAATYSVPYTHLVSGVVPQYVNARASEPITISGGFGDSVTAADVKVTIDGVECEVQTASSTTIECNSGMRTTTGGGTMIINIAGQERAASQGHTVLMGRKWSDEQTWSGEFPP